MDSKNLKVCACSFTIEWNNKIANLVNLRRIINEVHPETDLLILPETFSTGFPIGQSKSEVLNISETIDGETLDLLQQLARLKNIAIAGSFVAKQDDTLYNRAFFVEPSGDCYFADKAHLFRMGGENEIFTSGMRRLHVRYRGWNISLIVCYDLRFPVWCRNVDNEYDLLIVVANWPKSRDFVWDTLLKARAIENIAYVCGINCEGSDSQGNVYSGKSEIIDFKGKEIGIQSSYSLSYSELKKDALQAFREKFPAWKDSDKFSLDKKYP